MYFGGHSMKQNFNLALRVRGDFDSYKFTFMYNAHHFKKFEGSMSVVFFNVHCNPFLFLQRFAKKAGICHIADTHYNCA
jgi:hypothetical protein